MTKQILFNFVSSQKWDGLSLDALAIELADLIKNFGGDALVDICSNEDVTDIRVSAAQIETDEQYAYRLNFEKRRLEAVDANDLREFARLTEKFSAKSTPDKT